MGFGFGADDDMEFDPALLGLGATWGAFLAIVGIDGPLCASLGVPLMLAYFQTALVAGALASIALLATSFGSLVHYNHHLHSPAVRVAFAESGVASMLLGMLCLLPASATGTVSAWTTVGGILFGVGAALLLLWWGSLYAPLLPQHILFHAALALVIAQALFVAVSFLPETARIPAASLLLVVSAIPLGMRSRTLGKVNDGDRTPLAVPAVFRTLIKVLWKPLLGALLAAFIVGLTWDPVAAQEATVRASKTVWRFLIGPAIASGCILGFLHHAPKSFALHTLQEVFLPVAILLLLVMPFVDKTGTGMLLLTDIVSEFGFATVALVTWTSLTAAIRTTNLSPQIVQPAAFIVLAAAVLLGTWLIGLIGVSGKTLCLVITVVYLIVLVVGFALEDRTVSDSRELQRSIVERYLQQRCDQLRERYGLSEREVEVLRYLSRGYSQVYIAKELYISENTVRTHTRHIYTKMGIESREELLSLIDRDH